MWLSLGDGSIVRGSVVSPKTAVNESPASSSTKPLLGALLWPRRAANTWTLTPSDWALKDGVIWLTSWVLEGIGGSGGGGFVTFAEQPASKALATRRDRAFMAVS